MRRYQLVALLGGTAAIRAALMIMATSAVCQDSGKAAKLNSEVEHCGDTKDEQARTCCYKEENSSGVTNLSREQPIGLETWRLARTPNPGEEPDESAQGSPIAL
jgi:hypothetical protein